MIRKSIEIFCCILFIIILISCRATPATTPVTTPETTNALSNEPKKMGLEDENLNNYKADAETLIKNVEAKHIIFAINAVPEGYEKSKAAFLDSIKEDMSVYDFAYLANKYLSSLKDGHTQIFPLSSEKVLDVKWRWDGKSLIVIQGELPENACILSIGGIGITKIAELVDEYAAAENASAAGLNIERLSRYHDFLQIISQKEKNQAVDGSIEIYYELAGVKSSKTLSFSKNQDYIDRKPISYAETSDAFIFNLTECTMDDNWHTALNAMKVSIKKGTTKVIVDVRGNPGGDSRACTGILEALGMTPGIYGCTIYNNEDAAKLYKMKVGSIVKYNGSNNGTGSNIKLYVLIDRYSFSSATMMGVLTQDGGLGTLIGEISSNSPTCYGDALTYTLPNTKLRYDISWKRFERPDEKQSQTELIPDILVKPGENAMDYVPE